MIKATQNHMVNLINIMLSERRDVREYQYILHDLIHIKYKTRHN